jgi:hypothetical protein
MVTFPVAYGKMQYLDGFCLRNANKSSFAGRRHFLNNNWQMGRSDVMGLTRGLISCYQSFAPISTPGMISLWHFWCMGKIDVITYKYNVCDKSIYLFWYTFWVTVSNTLNVKDILKIYLIEQKIYPNQQVEWYVYHSDLPHWHLWLYCNYYR